MKKGTRCEWLVLCKNEATHMKEHPWLGNIPCCDRCTKLDP